MIEFGGVPPLPEFHPDKPQTNLFCGGFWMDQVATGCLALRQWRRIALRFAACLLAIAACSHFALA
jgi:hypothetical protein